MRLPIRVCFLIDRLRVAGTEGQLLALIRGLDRSVVTPYLCLLDGEDPVSRSLEPESCPVLRLGIRALHHPSTLRRASQFARFLRRERIDAVQTHFPDSTYFGALVAKLAGVRFVIGTQRNLGSSMKPIDRWLGRLYRPLTDVTVANCEACRQAAIAQLGLRPESVIVLPNGVDLARFAAIPPVAPSRNGRPRRVGMVANLRPVKGPDVFVRAAAIVSRLHPDVRFQLAGTGDEAAARRLAHECGIQDRLDLLGHVHDIPAFLSRLDVAVLTSHSEGLSNALLEYMAAGRPIVATAIGGNVELIENDVHGLLVPPGDPAAVASAIDRFLGDPALAARLGAAAKRRAMVEYSLESCGDRLAAFYARLASNGK